ncbi:uncharacterized protein LOC106881311 isoform X2 [Octopus bimaculoides]|uniref:Uncharacterized protein n=1 Tax=Octopus bimaculoides TaxID=37653 RepID=A0A0L8FT59_OCTBM|nr:uncharacterized protein LOC106881311 isoform X2 [Octopus bimaculoides]|eukprot:XP_014787137.1 PREDICTED: uncharacterized protein LOC106881311 isoform X2 [Octopus bimaculoides]
MKNVMNYDFPGRLTPASICTRAVRFTPEKKSAWLLAVEEEEKNVKQQQEKEVRLQKFQNRVRKRVAAIQQKKKQKELELRMKELDVAQDVLRNCMNTELQSSQQNTNKHSQTEQFTADSDNVDATLNKPNSHRKSNHTTINNLTTGTAKVNPRKTDVSVSSDETEEASGKFSFPLDYKEMVKDFNNGIGAKLSTVQSKYNMDWKSKKQQMMQRVLTRKMFMEMDRKKIKIIQQKNNLNAKQFISFYENKWIEQSNDPLNFQPKTQHQIFELEIDDWSRKHSKLNRMCSFYQSLL